MNKVLGLCGVIVGVMVMYHSSVRGKEFVNSVQVTHKRALPPKRKIAHVKKEVKTPWFRVINEGRGTVDAVMAFLVLNPSTDINAGDRSNNGKMALQYAANANNAPLCTYLLQQGANINAAFTIASSPIVGDPNNIKLALNSFVTVKSKAVSAILTNTLFLLYAATLPTLQPFKAYSLINAGAVVQASDNVGNTALHYAAQVGNAPICRVLIGAGAYLDVKNSAGQKPVDVAIGEAVALLTV